MGCVLIRKLQSGDTRYKNQPPETADHAWVLTNTHTFIDPTESENLFYTIGYSEDKNGRRVWVEQDIIPFDIDSVKNPQAAADAFFEAIPELDRSKCLVVATGNGIHVLIQIPVRITDKEWFTRNRAAYTLLSARVNAKFEEKGVDGKVDTCSFAFNRLLRLPNTTNVKQHKDSLCKILEGVLLPQDFDVAKVAGLEDGDFIGDAEARGVGYDKNKILSDCKFLNWMKNSPAEVSEPLWYAGISVLARVDKETAHSYSAGHPNYTREETDKKIEMTLTNGGPRTCAGVNKVWGRCSECPHFGKIRSPLFLKSDDFIATEKTGFYSTSGKGKLVPEYEDLIKFFQKEHQYVILPTKEIFIFDKTHFVPWTQANIREYARNKFVPRPHSNIMEEFTRRVQASNIKPADWFSNYTEPLINFSNGVLNTQTGTLHPHSANYPFLYVLPYPFTPTAACPAFLSFMETVLQNDTPTIQAVYEFLGHAICHPHGDELTKALLLVGEGANGKSTFLDIIRMVSGEANTASLSMEELAKETNRASLPGKLINVCEEMPRFNKAADVFKAVMGGTITVRRMYCDRREHKCTTKFVFAGNEAPCMNDYSFGLQRRLMIVPFRVNFLRQDKDLKRSREEITREIKEELPGIFNVLFEHYHELKKRNWEMTYSKTVKEAAETYAEDTDFVGTWIKENVHADDNMLKTISLQQIFDAFLQETKAQAENELSLRVFMKRVKTHLSGDRQTIPYNDRRVTLKVGGKAIRALRGVQLRNASAALIDEPQHSLM